MLVSHCDERKMPPFLRGYFKCCTNCLGYITPHNMQWVDKNDKLGLNGHNPFDFRD
jgi:hypothetical protein